MTTRPDPAGPRTAAGRPRRPALRRPVRTAARPAARQSLRALTVTLLGLAAVATATALAPRPADAQSACGAFHTVDTGDSLIEIAERCGVTLPALLAANPGVVDQRDVEVGDRLRIPDPDAPQPSPVEACGPAYTVRTGDSLAEIAEKCGLSIPLLVAANPSLPDPLGVDAGRTIRIPNLPRSAIADPATRVVERAAPADTAGAGADTTAGAPAPELTRVVGTLERGPVCLHVRQAGGDVVAIVGDVGNAFQPGDPVVLLGLPADPGACDHDPALELRILHRASGTRSPRRRPGARTRAPIP